MDLALHLGMTAGGLARAMTRRELRDWQRYAARRMLPWRRMEMYLAQLTAAVAGGRKSLSDFLFDYDDGPVDEVDFEDASETETAAFFGATVVTKIVE